MSEAAADAALPPAAVTGAEPDAAARAAAEAPAKAPAEPVAAAGAEEEAAAPSGLGIAEGDTQGSCDASKEGREPPKFQTVAHKALLALRVGNKVNLNNKIGADLGTDSWFYDAALQLQRGISGRSPSDFEAPAEKLFTRMRAAFGIAAPRYAAALGLLEGQNDPSLRLLAASSASGKSGAFFFLTSDEQLIAKSCTEKEWLQLQSILPSYVDHVERARLAQQERRRNKAAATTATREFGCCGSLLCTLLPAYLGMYKFSLSADGKNEVVRVIVMGNVFASVNRIDRRYDLKGSTHGRCASSRELAKKLPVLKDLDWLEQEPMIVLKQEVRDVVMSVLRKDVEFLAAHKLMDYSLLIGIHDHERDYDHKSEVMNVAILQDGKRCCFLGIVDVLTVYGSRKLAETFLHKLICRRNFSCVDPNTYARRFLDFVDERVFAMSE